MDENAPVPRDPRLRGPPEVDDRIPDASRLRRRRHERLVPPGPLRGHRGVGGDRTGGGLLRDRARRARRAPPALPLRRRDLIIAAATTVVLVAAPMNAIIARPPRGGARPLCARSARRRGRRRDRRGILRARRTRARAAAGARRRLFRTAAATRGDDDDDADGGLADLDVYPSRASRRGGLSGLGERSRSALPNSSTPWRRRALRRGDAGAIATGARRASDEMRWRGVGAFATEVPSRSRRVS